MNQPSASENSQRKTAHSPINPVIAAILVCSMLVVLFLVFSSSFWPFPHKVRRSIALSNCKALGLAITQYTQDYNEVLPMAGHRSYPSFRGAMTEWQEAIYPYVKNEKVYKDPADGQATDDALKSAPEVRTGGGRIAATSWLMNYNTTEEPSLPNGMRHAFTLAEYTSPSDFLLLLPGERQDTRFDPPLAYSGPPDHNGKQISIWGGSYVQAGNGTTEEIFNQCRDSSNPNLAGLPYHERGLIVDFLDGHVKFVVCDMANPAAALEAMMPWREYGYPNGQTREARGTHWLPGKSCGK